ncbi:MAG: pyridoxamine kinase [Clostridia bacterium]|nr:pyridoxamine kinase [Clostridia bacterium]
MQKLKLSTAPDRQKRVLAVHDISCVGRCSLTVALPVLSAMGSETSILPTSILSTHTGGFEGYTYRDLSADMNPIADHWRALGLRFDAIFTGWLGTHRHVENLAHLLGAVGPGAELIADPVMGDNGRLYATLDGDYVDAMRRFCGRAELLLPNITEAAILTGTEYPYPGYNRAWVADMLRRLIDLCPRTAVLTGVSLEPGRIGAAAMDRYAGEMICFEDAFIPGMWHGAGDVFASALIGAHLRGAPLDRALRLAVTFTARCIRRTRDAGTDERLGLQFEPELMTLADNPGPRYE